MKRLALIIAAAAACSGPATSTAPATAPTPAPDRRVANLRAFAVLFGYVKYFHPSDEAAATDWNRFAVLGARRVVDAGSRDELAAALRGLFEPIAPSVQIFATDAPPAAVEPAVPSHGFVPVRWQHQGDGVDTRLPGPYASARTHRPASLEEATQDCIVRDVDAKLVAGKQLRVRARARGATIAPGSAHLYIGWTPSNDNTSDYYSDALVLSDDWRPVEFTRTVPAAPTEVGIGVCFHYAGEVLVDDIAVALNDGTAWQEMTLDNLGFESGTDGWQLSRSGFDLGVVDGGAGGSAHAFRLRSPPDRAPGALFAHDLEPGATAEVALGDGLAARVPLVVWSNPEHTVPVGNPDALAEALAAVTPDDLADPAVRAGAAIVAWNALEHFFPYFDVVAVDWNAELDRALAAMLAATEGEGAAVALEHLVAALGDGHGGVGHDALRSLRGTGPIIVDVVEDQLVVTATDHADVRVGDVITHVDGHPAAAWRTAQMERLSGSPQWKRYLASQLIQRGALGSTVRVTLEHADGTTATVALTRERRTSPLTDRPDAEVRAVSDGIWYVDLNAAEVPLIRKHLPELAAAKGVVFDLRGYPRGNHFVLNHLLSERDDHKWMFVAHHARPGADGVVGWYESGWEMEPATPHIGGKVVFLTNAHAISYAESVMGFVDGYELADIVGSPTAGANGNVLMADLPGAFTVRWTGMKVLRHDGSQLFGLGIPPTHPVAPTIAGIRAGRDELLDHAVELIEQAQP